MRAFSVVPIEPGEQFQIERRQIGEQEILVITGELVLHGAVKAFAVRIHFGGFGISVPMREGEGLELLSEVAFEFTAIVGEHCLDAIGEDRFDESKELSGGKARVAAGSPGEGEMGVQVGKGDDKAPAIVGLPFDRIEGHAMPWMAGHEMFGLAWARDAFELRLAVGPDSQRRMTHLVFSISDQPPNGTHRRTTQLPLITKSEQKRMDLLLGEVRMVLADAPDLGNDRRCPLAMTPALRCRRGRAQGAFALPFRLPRKQRTAAHFKGIHARRQTVSVPELENFEATLRIFMYHRPA